MSLFFRNSNAASTNELQRLLCTRYMPIYIIRLLHKSMVASHRFPTDACCSFYCLKGHTTSCFIPMLCVPGGKLACAYKFVTFSPRDCSSLSKTTGYVPSGLTRAARMLRIRLTWHTGTSRASVQRANTPRNRKSNQPCLLCSANDVRGTHIVTGDKSHHSIINRERRAFENVADVRKHHRYTTSLVMSAPVQLCPHVNMRAGSCQFRLSPE